MQSACEYSFIKTDTDGALAAEQNGKMGKSAKLTKGADTRPEKRKRAGGSVMDTRIDKGAKKRAVMEKEGKLDAFQKAIASGKKAKGKSKGKNES